MKAYITAYFDNYGWQQLSAFDSSRDRDTFVQYLKDLGGWSHYDWYQVPTHDAITDAVERTKAMGGDVFNLPKHS